MNHRSFSLETYYLWHSVFQVHSPKHMGVINFILACYHKATHQLNSNYSYLYSGKIFYVIKCIVLFSTKMS